MKEEQPDFMVWQRGNVFADVFVYVFLFLHLCTTSNRQKEDTYLYNVLTCIPNDIKHARNEFLEKLY